MAVIVINNCNPSAWSLRHRERLGKVILPHFGGKNFRSELIFSASDGPYRLNRFYHNFPEAGVLIMGLNASRDSSLIVMGIRSFLIQPK